jgi:hypothetical protein
LSEPALETVRAHQQASTSTKKRLSLFEPQTPSWDPALIDRKGLVGVGELTTPRWISTAGSLAPSAVTSPVRLSTFESMQKESNHMPTWGTSIFDDSGVNDDFATLVRIIHTYAIFNKI